ERFIGVLIEHTAGNFPTWVAPVQAVVLPISEKHVAYARETLAELQKRGVRATIDVSEDKIGTKIRNAELMKVPYMLVVGEKEAAAGAVRVRRHGKGDLGSRSRTEFLEQLILEIAQRSAHSPESRN